MPLHSQIAGNRVEITARTLASTLRISEFRLESDSAHLLLLSAGEAEIIQGEKTLPVPAPGLVWLPIGPAGRLRLTAGSRGSLLRTSEIGLAHAMPTGTSASAVRNILQRVLTQAPAEKDRQELAGYLETIARENVRSTTGSDTIIASLLSVTLIRICQHAIADIAGAVSTPGSLTERFVLLVSQHKRDQWGVEDYARQLGVNRERLGFAVRKATGLSPQAYIHRELLSEARDLLLNSSLQVAEIAFRLGFQDPGYFNRFFTRNEGTSPGRFRRTATRMQNVPPPSYAAWP
ncbi:helix-turn-helix transcriptional regulator [Agrobacterium tumefaciens]|uniref:helix-turn-helix transcriptional regulator n=1 Tax=Agrobacterium tumefaciens TaxID=358 RepID=UPI0015735402|nr:helix-turn-helix transcriptional regulator [Agrobacterium tumefaciens]NTE37418.1 helix-turn-helix domain-containing protein [Agrobacterium tumefaciens]NTE52927.1 helix-turn-helix domain-containing protein [Agrobacterium tumefaciens]